MTEIKPCPISIQMQLDTANERIAELENALKWSRDSNTGYEPSVSVMHRYYDELLPKGGAE